MYKASVDNAIEFQIAGSKNETTVNGDVAIVDWLKINDHTYHVLLGSKSFLAEVVDQDLQSKTFRIKVNNTIYDVNLKDRFDALLHQLGMDNLTANKVSEVKAPMPGMVLKVFVKAGDEVEKGDNLFVLEAMKMENIVKSPTVGKVVSVAVKPQDKVEKNQTIIRF